MGNDDTDNVMQPECLIFIINKAR